MWFDIEIKIKGHKDPLHLNFTTSSYDSIKHETTINLEVFTFRVEELYEQIPDKYNSYPTLFDFTEALIKNEINEIYLTRLNSLYSFLEHVLMYRDVSKTPRLNNGVQVFCNKFGYTYSSKMDFKNLVAHSTLTPETKSDLKAQFIVFLAKVAEFVMTIKVTPKNTKEYSLKTTTFSKDIFKDVCEDLARRYAVLPKPSKVKNLIVDSFLPEYFIKHKFNLEKIQEEFKKNMSSSATMIHRGFARTLGIRELPLDDMLAMLGYTKERIHELLLSVRAKKFNIIFAGYGGVGANTIYWLTELCNMTNIQGLFNKILITDFDKLSLDNIFRMPNPFKTFTSDYYMVPVQHTNPLDKIQTILNDSLKALSTKTAHIKRYELAPNVFNASHVDSIHSWIVYGAPNIDARKMLSRIVNDNIKDIGKYNDIFLAKRIKAFISATHGDDSCGLTINPSYLENETNLMMESYGIIQLNVFFFNQLRLAISFLEALEQYSLKELHELRDIEFLKDYSIVDNQKSNKYNIAFRNIRTINTVENIERES